MNVNAVNNYLYNTTGAANGSQTVIPGAVQNNGDSAASGSVNTDMFEHSSDKTASDIGLYSPVTSADALFSAKNIKDEDLPEELRGQGTYHTYDEPTVKQLLADSEKRVQEFRDWVFSVLGLQSQHETKKIFDKDGNELVPDENGMVDLSNVEGVEEFEFDDKYWGAEATAQRIFDMAKAFGGENEALLGLMKKAVYAGFAQVEGLFGGEGSLPDVCYETKDKFDELFNSYCNELFGNKDQTQSDMAIAGSNQSASADTDSADTAETVPEEQETTDI
ncbi:MAG: hypothetical protein IJ446_03360 [Oscillospiraceae bacterium]|nr:hypothetical protein [Oscillospiraceae bacterium]